MILGHSVLCFIRISRLFVQGLYTHVFFTVEYAVYPRRSFLIATLVSQI